MIQGVLVHGQKKYGRGATLFRCCNNIKKSASLTIHCIMTTLENWRADHKGNYPNKIYIQIDGGSENTNKWILAVCEYLIIQRAAKHILLTRLPTGHTHEDIGKFWFCTKYAPFSIFLFWCHFSFFIIPPLLKKYNILCDNWVYLDATFAHVWKTLRHKQEVKIAFKSFKCPAVVHDITAVPKWLDFSMLRSILCSPTMRIKLRSC
jgi:hypothetical protein